MAAFNFPDAENRQKIAILLGSWTPGFAGENACSVAETLEVCTVAFSDLQDRSKSPRDILRKEGLWHAQVVSETNDYYFARVSPTPDGENWEVYSLYESDIAKDIDTALTWVDQNFGADETVRIIEIPELFIIGLILENGEAVKVYIVSKAPGLAIDTGRLYDFEEMRDILAQLQPVRGVNLKPDHSNSMI